MNGAPRIFHRQTLNLRPATQRFHSPEPVPTRRGGDWMGAPLGINDSGRIGLR